MAKYLEFEDLTEKQYQFFMDYIYNGVGSDQLGVKGPEFIFRAAAKVHDFEGYGGGTEEDRIISDNKFLASALLEIKKRKPYKKYIYTPIAYLYYYILKIFSKAAWDYYPERPKTWKEFLIRVEAILSKQNKQVPWPKRFAKFLTRRNIKNKDMFLKLHRKI